MRRPVGVKGILVSFCLPGLFLPARLPLSPCFHPHSQGAIGFARCMLGVLNSAGAAICLATCRSLKCERGPGHRRSHRNSALDFCLFSSWNGFVFTRLRLLWLGSCYAKVRILRRSPTGDAATRPAFSQSPQ